MPRGDRTGPEGMGPRTGRGMGFCSGYNSPGFAGGFGRGRGMRRGGGFFGRGRGFRNWDNNAYNAAPYTEEERAQMLKEEYDVLKKRVEELEKELNK